MLPEAGVDVLCELIACVAASGRDEEPSPEAMTRKGQNLVAHRCFADLTLARLAKLQGPVRRLAGIGADRAEIRPPEDGLR